MGSENEFRRERECEGRSAAVSTRSIAGRCTVADEVVREWLPDGELPGMSKIGALEVEAMLGVGGALETAGPL